MTEKMRQGRQCAVCTSGERASIEAAYLEGESIRAISARGNFARSSLRRHMAMHLVIDASTASAVPLNASSIALRVLAVAERAREVAEEALDAGDRTQTFRAGDAELRALAVLASLGVKHETALHELDAYRTVTHAVIRAARRNPEVGGYVARQLDAVDREAFAADLRSQIQETTKGLTP